MARLKNFLMGEAEAGRFVFPEPPDYPDEVEYYGCGITWGQARDMLDNLPSQPEWTDEQLNDYERQNETWEQKTRTPRTYLRDFFILRKIFRKFK